MDEKTALNRREGLFGLAIDRPVTVLMIVLGVVVFGLVALTRIPLSLMPELSYPTITVRTTYEGAAPEEVENNISVPLEEALGVVTRLKRIQSISRTDESVILLEFDWETDMNLATQEVSEKLERVFLPPEAEKPLILRYDPTQDPVLRLSLFGPVDMMMLRTFAEQDFKRELEKISGVAAVKVRGGLEEEVRVFFDEDALSQGQLDIEALNRTLAAQNINLAGGKLKEGSTEYVVRTVNEFRDLGEIADAVVGERQGVPLRVRDIARVERSFKDRDMVTRVNGRESVEVEIYKEADANIVALSRTLQERLGGGPEKAKAHPAPEGGEGHGDREAGPPRSRPLSELLPKGVELKIISDQAEFITMAMGNLRSAALGGGLLAMLVLYFFLKRFGPTFIVGLAIPISVITTFAAMYLFDVTLNIMSLGGLALGVGMLVDNAIVVLESIARCREEGDAPRAAALRGVHEVGMAVTASTLTSVAVFFPIVFVEGIAGQVFRDLSMTVVFSLLASLVVSLFFIPMVSARSLGIAPRRETSGCPLREVLVPAHWDLAAARLRGSEGFGRKALAIARFPFTLAMGAPRAAPAPPRAEGEPETSVSPRRLLKLITVPLGGLFDFLTGLLAILATALGYLVKVLLVLGEVAILWVLGALGWAARRALSLPMKLFDSGMGRLLGAYRGAVRKALARPARVLSTTGLAFVALLAGFGLIDTQLIPQLHNRTLEVETTLPVGTPLENTDASLREVARRIQELPEVEGVALQSGVAKDDLKTTEGGQFSSRMTVTLTRRGSLRRVEDRAVNGIRTLCASVPDLKSKVRFPSLFSTRTPVEVEVYADELDRLSDVNRESVAALSSVEGLTDVQTSLSKGHPEIQISYDRQRLAQYGLDIAAVASTVRTKVLGQVQTKFDKGREKVDIRVQVRPEDRTDIAQLGTLVVNPGAPTPVPLAAVADLRVGVGPSEIRRIDQQRVAVLSANLGSAGFRSATRGIEAALASVAWKADEGYRIGGQKDEMDRSSRSLLLALVLSIFLVYLVMASQFESLLHPFLIMFTIPLALFGVVVVLVALSIPLSILVFIGMIMLAGIVVNNAIILVDYVNTLRGRGTPLAEALEEGGAARLRPILMTTLTTLFGLAPLALGLGAGAELQSPMAITVMAGLAFSTLLTLLVIPTLYYAVERRRGKPGGASGGGGP